MNARMKKRFHTDQHYASKVLARERARFMRNPDPFILLVGATADSKHSMLARELAQLTNISARLPAHIAYGFHPITAASVINQYINRCN